MVLFRISIPQFRGSFDFIIILSPMNLRTAILTCFLPAFLLSCSSRPEEKEEAPPGDFRLVELHYENSSGEKAVTHFYYDPEGRNYMAIWHLEDSSRSSVNHHTLDSAGKMIVKSREFSDGIRSVQHFEYGPEGNLVSEDFSRSDGVTGRADYYYTQDGRLESADCRGLNGWFYGRIEYAWENGLRTGAELFRDSVSIGSIAYEYREGRLTGEQWDINDNWSQTFRYEYQEAFPQAFVYSNVFIRENPWYRVRSEFYEFDGGTGGPLSGGPTSYTYDESGKLISREYIRSDGLSTMSTYEYDTTGVLVQSHRDYGDGRSMDFVYWYNGDRKLLVKTFTSTNGTAGSETYRYRDGRLVRGEYVNVDGWLNGTLEFECDADGTVRSGVYSGKDGEEGSVDFTWDLDFNLVKIHWAFGSGQTQTYDYEYEASQ
jgi:hypothetical protein